MLLDQVGDSVEGQGKLSLLRYKLVINVTGDGSGGGLETALFSAGEAGRESLRVERARWKRTSIGEGRRPQSRGGNMSSLSRRRSRPLSQAEGSEHRAGAAMRFLLLVDSGFFAYSLATLPPGVSGHGYCRQWMFFDRGMNI